MTRRFVARTTITCVLLIAAIALTRGYRPLGRGSAWIGALQRPVAAATMTVAAWFDALLRVVRDPGTVRTLDADIASLRAQVATLTYTVTEFADLRREAARTYPAALGVPISAHVVAALLEPGIQEMTAAYRLGDEVRDGDPVLAHGALIGTVRAAGPARAVVQLLTDHRTSIGVQLATTPGTIGILEASPGGGVVVTHIPSDRTVSVSDSIVTSMTNASIPPGLPIGRIAAIRTDPDGFFRTAAIDLIVDPARILACTILTQRRP